MGKKHSRKYYQKKSKLNKGKTPSMPDLNISSENITESKYDQFLDIDCIKDQVKHYISRIYSEFAQDLDERRAKSLLSRNLFVENNLPNLKITTDFIKKMDGLLTIIKDSESIREIQNFVYKHANIFVDQLKESFLDMFNARKQLQIILMHEAYSYLINVSKEITRLLSSILNNNEKRIRTYHKLLFYQKVMKDRKDLQDFLAGNKSQSYSETQMWKKFKKFEKIDLPGSFFTESEFSEEVCTRSMRVSTESNVSEKDSNDCISFFSIDQVVNYIEGSPKRQKSKKKKSKASTNFHSNSSQNIELELEIIEFEKKLDLSPARMKPKLILPDNFLQELRDKIRQYRNKINLS